MQSPKDEPSKFPYKFLYGEPGMFIEIYIPTSYETHAHHCLEKGYEIDAVNAYLKKNGPEIADLLEESDLYKDYASNAIRLIDTILYGFSIYRGDGSFFDGDVIQRDEVAIVRLMFKPPLEELCKSWCAQNNLDWQTCHEELQREARFAARRYFRFYTHDLAKYKTDRNIFAELARVWTETDHPLHKAIVEIANTTETDAFENELLNGIKDWLGQVGLFVHGYVVHSICSQSKWREDHHLGKMEDEIWVGSFRSLAVNRIKKR